MIVPVVVPVVAMGAAAGCVSKASGGGGPQASFDSGFPDIGFPEDSSIPTDAPTDVGPADSGAASEAAAVSCLDASPLPDGACNALAQLETTPITGTCGVGAQPSGTGGTIADGTYLLTAQARYIDSGCAPASFQATMVIGGGCFDRVDGAGDTALTRDGTFTTSGNVMTRDVTCGLSLPAATYTASDTQLVIFDEGGSVTTWTKQ